MESAEKKNKTEKEEEEEEGICSFPHRNVLFGCIAKIFYVAGGK